MSQPPLPLPANRAFVVQLRDQPPEAPLVWDGRAEHVVSGQMAHLHAMEELVAFICRVLEHQSSILESGILCPFPPGGGR